jgi:ferredoxin
VICITGIWTCIQINFRLDPDSCKPVGPCSVVDPDLLNPDTDSLNPDTDSLNPDTDSLNPDTDSLNPDTDSLTKN